MKTHTRFRKKTRRANRKPFAFPREDQVNGEMPLKLHFQSVRRENGVRKDALRDVETHRIDIVR